MGSVSVPASAKKMVESLKEVVNCSDTEIYATLNECNMDLDQAVTRLLSQDPFHKVKSKREKKKEGKDTNDYRPCGANNSSARGGKSVAEPYLGHGGSTHYYSSVPSKSGLIQRKYIYMKKTEATPYTSSLTSAPSISGNTNSGTTGLSDHENIGPSLVGGSGQLSLADIVKMGRPHNKVATAHDGSHNNGCSSRFPDTNISKPQDEWPSTDTPVASVLESLPEITVDSHVPPEDLVMRFNSEYQDHEAMKDDETREKKDFVGFHSISSREFPDDDSRRGSQYKNDLSNMSSSNLPQERDFERHAVDEVGASVPSVTSNMQQLSVESNERGLPSEGEADVPLTIQFPDHLKVNSGDFSHLSFGNFHAGMSTPCSSSGAVTSLPVETSLEERHNEVKIPSVSHPDTRELEYYGGDSFRKAAYSTSYNRTRSSDESSAPKLKPPKAAGVLDYRLSSSVRDYSDDDLRLINGTISKLNFQMQNQLQQPANADLYEYHIPSSVPDYSSSNRLPNKPTWADDLRFLNTVTSQMNMKMQNQASFCNDTHQSYPSGSLPSTLLAANVQPKHSRESELGYYTQKVAQYGLPASAIGISTMSMSEALKTPGLPSVQPAPHNLPGTSSPTGGLPLQQHMALDPYSQPTRPSDPYANMIGCYPSLPQSSACMPSAFQQKMANNSPYHQSAVNMPHSADITSRYGYGGPIGEGTISRNFSMKPPNTLSGSYLNYENENSSMWPHDQEPISRTIYAVPSSTCTDYLGQGQQPGGFRQSRQTSSTYGLQGYHNYYHSQQIPRYGSQDCSQGQPRQY